MWKTQAPLFWTYVRKPLACWNHTNRTVFFWDGFMLPGPDALKLSKHSYSHVVFYIRAPGSFGISGFYSYKQWWFVSSSSFCSAAQWYCCCLETFSSLTHSVAGDKLQLWPGVGRKQLRGHSSACPALAAVTQRGAQHAPLGQQVGALSACSRQDTLSGALHSAPVVIPDPGLVVFSLYAGYDRKTRNT